MAYRYPVVLVLTALALPALSVAQDASFRNLQVLPTDIARAELNRVMLDNLLGLGLPRRRNEGCLHCHVGDMDRAVDTWDFASDSKPAKRTARVMMRMVQDINERHLADLDDRVTPRLEVSCQTCHAGRTDPRPLPDVLWGTYEQNGIAAAVDQYRRLRNRYFGGDAYDFRVGMLSQLADRLAAAGAYDDALALATANLESYPESGLAHQSRMIIVLARRIGEQDVQAALLEFERMRASDSGIYITPALLDGLGWGLTRAGAGATALGLFERNRSVYPDEYVPMESLADALWQGGDRVRPIEMFEAWLASEPDHEMARRRLTNLRVQTERR